MDERIGNEAYAKAWEELEGGRRDTGCWAKAIAESNGDEAMARARYLRERAAFLANATTSAQADKAARDVTSSPDTRSGPPPQRSTANTPLPSRARAPGAEVPVEILAESIGTTTEAVIADIRAGNRVGSLRGGAWFVQPGEAIGARSTPLREVAQTRTTPTGVELPVDEVAKLTGLSAEEVVAQVKAGDRVGSLRQGEWYARTDGGGGDRSGSGGPVKRTSFGPYRSLRTIGQPTRILLIILLGLSIIGIVSTLGELQMLDRMERGDYTSQAAMERAADSNNRRQQIIGAGQLGLMLILAFFVASWIYRANQNVHALGAQGLSATPGWSIGWYFIPGANLVMPYRAMRDIFKASMNPKEWKSEATSPLLIGWWLLFLATSLLGKIAWNLSMTMGSFDEIRRVSVLYLMNDGLLVGLILIWLTIMKQVSTQQAFWADD
jgi:hypothetical protein